MVINSNSTLLLEPKQILKIAEGDVHIWFSLTRELRNSSLLNQYKNMLSEEETKQFSKFFYEADSRQYLASRALLRTVLSKYVPIFPKQWKFSRSVYGKPYINNSEDDSSTSKLSFNLTHTDGLVMVGITKATDIGIDSEKISRKPDYIDIAYSNFAKDEILVLQSMPIIEKYKFFYKSWTLKEAYLKARGVGLAMPLDLFSFTFHNNRITCNFSDDLIDCCSNWKFFQFNPAENYISSICIRNNQLSNPHIYIRKSIPLVSETKINDYELLSS